MENLGSLALLFAFCFAIYTVLAALVGKWKDRAYLAVSAERAVIALWALVTTAAGTLVYLLFQNDFRLSFVAAHSNRDLPAVYKFAAWWGGQEGSLLFWLWILSTYAVVAVYTNRRKHRDMMPYVITILVTVQCFFLILVNFVANPFQVLAAGGEITAVPDGRGLNPLLQYPAMVIHPPFLYLGYVGFCVPFAFAAASLITKQKGEAWIATTRIWTMVTWLFQTCGIMLGARWAYAVLGWGGYWAWDPVENASLLPWITATAYLHSVMMQEKKGMMKVWNIVLISATFFLCIFGTFLTRSGVVSSVHAFAQSPIGKYFVVFLALGIAATVYLILNRLDFLKSENQLESLVSRESSFLFNNLLLLASCFAVLWGTLFPVLSEAVTGEKISVGAPFFNKVNVPIGLFLLFLTGVGPLFAWRRTSVESLKRNFLWPSVVSLALGAALLATVTRNFYALMAFMLSCFVGLTILAEFYKGARAIQAKGGGSLVVCAAELTHRNTRRYGGYIIHMGIVFMFIGFTGAVFTSEAQQEMNLGDTLKVAAYSFRLTDLKQTDNRNYASSVATIEVSNNGELLQTMHPERRFYHASEQPTSEVAIRPRLKEDVYVVFAGMSNEGQKPVIQVFVNPLVNWVWLGTLVVIGGTLIALVPSKVKLAYARTQVLGTTKKHEVLAQS
ncbi:MAG: heme lyase CcmF/NrfE family subunit [Acidobacteria bacterium]|nr:heme lyase CcmF/NrfE family subunit [Acidobacteriota bacterium]